MQGVHHGGDSCLRPQVGCFVGQCDDVCITPHHVIRQIVTCADIRQQLLVYRDTTDNTSDNSDTTDISEAAMGDTDNGNINNLDREVAQNGAHFY